MEIFNKFKNIFKKKLQEKVSKVNTLMITPFGSAGVSTEHNYEEFAKETYLKNIISYRCIDIIAKSISSVDWKIFTEQGDEKIEIDNHPMNPILIRANPFTSFSAFLYSAISYLLISGNSFIEGVSATTGLSKGFPQELHTHRPDRMKIITDDFGLITGYEYSVNGQVVLFEADPVTGQSDILQLKFFNPLDEYWGTATTWPARGEIDTSNASVEFNLNLIQNQARPSMMVLVEGALQEDEYNRLERSLKDKREGSKNAGKSFIMEGIKDVKPYGFTPQELDFIESNRELSRRIAFAYGVPTQLLGIPGDNTYANFQEARLSFWEETIFYYLNMFRDEMNNWIFGIDSNEFMDYILEGVPALQEKRNMLWTRAQEATFLTENEKREMVGFDSVGPEGDVILVPSMNIPLSAAVTEPETETQIDNENNKVVKSLMQEGYSEEEAKTMIGEI